MKKLIFLLTALLLICFFASCESEPTVDPVESGNETVGGDVAETGSETENKGPITLGPQERAQFHKLVEFELPENFRDAIVDYMKKCAEIKWVAAKNFSMTQDNGDWDVSLSYKRGMTYYGIPYTDYTVNYDYFKDELVNGQYMPKALGWTDSPGLNCYSSIILAYQQFEPYDGTVSSWIPGDPDFWLEKVGDYEPAKNYLVTKETCEFNGKDKISEAYASLQKGDIIYQMNNIQHYNMHCRVVVGEPTVVRNGAGKIIPSRSYVTCIEQTNQFDKSRTDGVKTTWYIDHTYTFDNLYERGYLPLTLKAYNKPLSEMEVPYIGIDTEITASGLSKGAIAGTISSNFRLIFVRAEMLDKDGKVVVSEEKGDVDGASPLRNKLGLRSSFSSMFNELEKGKEYTFVLKAGIAPGNVEFARVDFTYNG